jgi:hypothetical protein
MKPSISSNASLNLIVVRRGGPGQKQEASGMTARMYGVTREAGKRGELLVREFAPELEVRSSAKGGDGRTVEGICVPYRQRQRIDASLVEMFAPGAFSHQIRAANRVLFTREHVALGGTIIGKAVELRDDAAGLWGAWRVSRTPVGDENARPRLRWRPGRAERPVPRPKDRVDPDGTVVREKADLVEVAVVLEGAYGRGALISGVRQRAGRCAPSATAPVGAAGRVGTAVLELGPRSSGSARWRSTTAPRTSWPGCAS